MTVGQIRTVKRILFALFVGFGSYVLYHVFQGVRGRGETVDVPPIEVERSISRQVQIEQLDSEGETAWALKAAENTGHTETSQHFRDAEIHFNAGEEGIPVVVTAEECEVRKDETVHLKGNVVVRDDTSLRLEASTLHFRRYPDQVWTSQPVRYSKEGLTGEAGHMRYFTRRGHLDLGGGVSMTIRNRGEAPVHIRSLSASMRRKQHWVQYVDDVRVRQGNRSLTSNDLQLYLTEDNQEIERIEAYERVDLRLNVPPEEPATEDGDEPETVEGTAVLAEPGSKRLLTKRLEMFLRPGGEHLERVRALQGGRLIMRRPENAVDGYHKELEGYTLAFDFDEQGRLLTLRARGGTTLVLEPAAASGEETKIVTARQLESEFEPDTGELVEARCYRAVEFEQVDVKASAEEGIYDVASSRLILRQSPRLWDLEASVAAEEIRVDIERGDVEGIGKVRSTSKRATGRDGVFPAQGEGPVYFVAEHLTYDRSEDRALYTGMARGFRGRNRIEAQEIEIFQRQRQLAARGDVTTVLVPGEARGDGKSPADGPTTTGAERLVYRARTRTLEYRGAVEMRSPNMTLAAESVDVLMDDSGREVREILAEGEIEVRTEEGTATGELAKYLPNEERFTVTGDRARLENAGKLTEGKQLTFFLTDDRIFVDGQEQSRTKTTYSSKPRPFH